MRCNGCVCVCYVFLVDYYHYAMSIDTMKQPSDVRVRGATSRLAAVCFLFLTFVVCLVLDVSIDCLVVLEAIFYYRVLMVRDCPW